MREVFLVFRKKNPRFFSIEKVFANIRDAIESRTTLDDIELPFYNNGLTSIFRNILFLRSKSSTAIYHITGDVHYAVLALPASRTILTIHDCVFMHSNTGFKRKVLTSWPKVIIF